MEMIQPLLALMLLGVAMGGGFEPALMDPWSGLAGVILYLGLGWLITRRSTRRALATPDGAASAASGADGFFFFSCWVLLLFGTTWAQLAWSVSGGTPGVAHLVGFVPYVGHRMIRCIASWPLEARLGRRSWSRGEYVVFHLRVMMLVVVPVLIAQGALEALQRVPALARWAAAYGELVLPLGSAGVLAAVFMLAPVMVRWILGARPLERGPLRQRLEDYGARTGFRPNDILVWRTGDSITNALYIGILPRLRYVVLTDALLSKLEPAQVEAVYAHEAGHGMRRHTLLFMLLAVSLVLISSAMLSWIQARLGPALSDWDPTTASLVMWGVVIAFYGALLALFFLVGLGWLSRRFETEADLYAVRTLGDSDHFVSALESVGLHMGALSRRKGGLRHFSIGTRIGLVNRYTSEPLFRRSFDRLLRGCRAGVVLALALAVTPYAVSAPTTLLLGGFDLRMGEIWEAEQEGSEAEVREGYARLAEDLRQAGVDRGEHRGALRRREVAALAALADLDMRAGRYEEARETLNSMKVRVRRSDALGWFNTRNLEVILDALAGDIDVPRVRRLISDFDDLMQRLGWWNESVDATYTDLFLVLRAGGDDSLAPGRPGDYSPIARMMLSFQEDLRADAREDLERNAHRRDLVKRCRPELVERL